MSTMLQTEQVYKVTQQQQSPEVKAAVDSYLSRSVQAGIIVEKVMGPASSGHLELKTLDAKDNPKVTFNYFKDPEDLQKCVLGMKTVIQVTKSKAVSKFRYRTGSIQLYMDTMVALPLNLRPKHITTTFSLEQFCKDTVLSMWHYHGGCHVNKVVDHDYKVLGVDALRVIDGSTFYFDSPGTNPQATVMMLGRYIPNKINYKHVFCGHYVTFIRINRNSTKTPLLMFVDMQVYGTKNSPRAILLWEENINRRLFMLINQKM